MIGGWSERASLQGEQGDLNALGVFDRLGVAMKSNLMTDKPAPVVPPNATLRPQRWQPRPKPSLPKRVLSLSKNRFELHRTWRTFRGFRTFPSSSFGYSRDACHVCGSTRLALMYSSVPRTLVLLVSHHSVSGRRSTHMMKFVHALLLCTILGCSHQGERPRLAI